MIVQTGTYAPHVEAPICKASKDRSIKGARAERLVTRERYKRSLCAQAQAQRIVYSAYQISQSSPNLF